jgi:hypothetical protein
MNFFSWNFSIQFTRTDDVDLAKAFMGMVPATTSISQSM